MKPSLAIMIITSLMIGISCEKDEPSKPVEFSEKLKGTVWTGEMKYNDKSLTEPYSLYLDHGGKIEWNELSGKYTGEYDVDSVDSSLTVNFDGGQAFTASISAGRIFSIIKYPSVYNWNVISGELNDSTLGQLTGIWTGTITTAVYTCSLNFQNPDLVVYEEGTYFSDSAAYSNKYGALRFSLKSGTDFFGIRKGRTIHGVSRYFNGTSFDYEPWMVSKD
jgi:hypothetical protein